MTPYPADANGDTVRLVGRNFADLSNDVNAGGQARVAVGNLQCDGLRDESATTVMAQGASAGSASSALAERALVCATRRDTVGPKNVTVFVAAQDAFLSHDPMDNVDRLGTAFFFQAVCMPTALNERA